MTLLANLLPGFREVRAPLIAGYVWVLALWIAVGDNILELQPYPPALESLVQLGNWLGKTVLLGAISVCAYIIGIISNTTNRLLEPRLLASGWDYRNVVRLARGETLRRIDSSMRCPGPRSVSRPLFEMIRRRAIEQYSAIPDYQGNCHQLIDRAWQALPVRHPDRALLVPATVTTAELVVKYPVLDQAIAESMFGIERKVAEVLKDLEPTVERLIGAEPELHGEFDRWVAEAQFRISLFVPATALVGVLSWRFSWFYLFGLVAPVALLMVGRRELVNAYAKISIWLSAGRVNSPVLDEIMAQEHPYDIQASSSPAADRFVRLNLLGPEPVGVNPLAWVRTVMPGARRARYRYEFE
ncbi:hypothetical protein ACI2K4_23880 [Micromonospora sp. NPDC050397]|uniref:hypothetical protein n=1 Tax=Micromonospora sp. NPDC050397 TaxID=3364279 RepID=UPI00384ABABE